MRSDNRKELTIETALRIQYSCRTWLKVWDTPDVCELLVPQDMSSVHVVAII